MPGPIIKSSALGTRYFVGDNQVVVDATCPIDGTPLVAEQGYDFARYSCHACDADYPYGMKNPEDLRALARDHIRVIEKFADTKRNELTKLEHILNAAKQNGIL